MAPAGNPEGFYGAIHAGADAVYLGGARFGARAYADNFTQEELLGCIRYAHLWGRKVYMTVNTLVKDSEWEELTRYLCPYVEAGLDGAIVQDLGVLSFLRDRFPELALHASTQMTLTGPYGADFLKSLGVSRIVPARELSLSEIRHLKEKTGLEMETFVHGAMCYCYSGQCLFSSLLGGRSGNRGRCAQPCRLPYEVLSGGKRTGACYPLSLKDLCTIEHLPGLIEAGIDSFKIEGRMKKPEYTAGVTEIYRKYIDAYYAHPHKEFRVAPRDRMALSRLYIRSGVQDGYYFRQNGREMVTLDSPAYSPSDEALLEDIRKRRLERRLSRKVDIYAQLRKGEPATLTLLCQSYSVTVTGETVQAARKQPITEENVAKQLQRLGDTIFDPGQLLITLDNHAFYSLKALNELRREAVTRLEEQIIGSYQGETSKSMGEKTEREGDASFAGTSSASEAGAGIPEDAAAMSGMAVSIRTLGQTKALLEFLNRPENQRSGHKPVDRVYLDGDLVTGVMAGDALPLAKELGAKCGLFLAFPRILREWDVSYLKELLKAASQDWVAGCQVKSLDGYAYLKAHGFSKRIAADHSFYIWNRRTLSDWRKRLDIFCLPLELNAGEQSFLLRGLREEREDAFAGNRITDDSMETGSALNPNASVRAEKVIYGYLPMMVTANCIAKTTDRCHRKEGDAVSYLVDRYGKRFPVLQNCRHCLNIIYNSVPLSLHHSCGKWLSMASPRLDFTLEDAGQTGNILQFFDQILFQKKSQLPLPYTEYTTAHEKRCVE